MAGTCPGFRPCSSRHAVQILYPKAGIAMHTIPACMPWYEAIVVNGDLFTMRPSLKSAVVVALGGLMLCLAALYNGYPLLNPDSYGYVIMAIEGIKYWPRSIYYSYLIYPFHFEKTLWPVVIMQAIMVAHLIRLVQRVTLGRVGHGAYLGIMWVLTCLTALPWLAGFIMADIFTSVLILTTFLLCFARDRLTRGEKIYVFALCTAAVTVHPTHAPLAIWLIFAVLVTHLRFQNGLRSVTESIVPVAVAALLGLAGTLAANVAYHGWNRATGYGQVFALARSLEDGPAYRYLQDHCPDKKYALCGYLEELGGDSDRFLWEENSPLKRAGGAVALADEASDIVRGSISAYPLEHVKHAVKNTFALLVRPWTGRGMSPCPPKAGDKGLVPGLAKIFPIDRAFLYSAKQHRGALPFRYLNLGHQPVRLMAFILCMVALHPMFRLREDPLFYLNGIVLAGILGQAFISASISGVHGRYQTRVTWLLLFVSMAIVIRLWDQRRQAVRRTDAG
jgi:hypothetical protein